MTTEQKDTSNYDIEKYCDIELTRILSHAKNLAGTYDYFMIRKTNNEDENKIVFFNLTEGTQQPNDEEGISFVYNKKCTDGTKELNEFLYNGNFKDFFRDGCEESGCSTKTDKNWSVEKNWDAFLRDEWDSLRAGHTPLELPWIEVDPKTKLEYSRGKVSESLESGLMEVVDENSFKHGWTYDAKIQFREATGEIIEIAEDDIIVDKDISIDDLKRKYTHFKIWERKNQKGYELYLYKPNKLGEFTVEENESIYFEEIAEVFSIIKNLAMTPELSEEEIEKNKETSQKMKELKSKLNELDIDFEFGDLDGDSLYEAVEKKKWIEIPIANSENLSFDWVDFNEKYFASYDGNTVSKEDVAKVANILGIGWYDEFD